MRETVTNITLPSVRAPLEVVRARDIGVKTRSNSSGQFAIYPTGSLSPSPVSELLGNVPGGWGQGSIGIRFLMVLTTPLIEERVRAHKIKRYAPMIIPITPMNTKTVLTVWFVKVAVARQPTLVKAIDNRKIEKLS